MFTTRIDDKTIDMLEAIGDNIATEVDKLENLIWLVKAEAIRQLAEATRAYTLAFDENRTLPELSKAVEVAAARVNQLDKFWSQEVGMRNRAVQFGNMRSRRVPGFLALEEVMKRYLEKTAEAEQPAA